MPPRPTLAIADDDPDQADLLSAWLEGRGCRVLSFPSGDELVRWASRSRAPVDAFLLDLEMPGRDGIHSYRALRGIPVYEKTPTVLVSGAREERLAEARGEPGVAGVVRKDAQLFVHLGAWLAGYAITATT